MASQYFSPNFYGLIEAFKLPSIKSIYATIRFHRQHGILVPSIFILQLAFQTIIFTDGFFCTVSSCKQEVLISFPQGTTLQLFATCSFYSLTILYLQIWHLLNGIHHHCILVLGREGQTLRHFWNFITLRSYTGSINTARHLVQIYVLVGKVWPKVFGYRFATGYRPQNWFISFSIIGSSWTSYQIMCLQHCITAVICYLHTEPSRVIYQTVLAVL